MAPARIDSAENDLAKRYLDIVKKMLVRWGEDELVPISPKSRRLQVLKPIIRRVLGNNVQLFRWAPFNPQVRAGGRDWPAQAETMIGLKRLQNLQDCVESVIRDRVEGDLVETGVWRGGASIFMAALLKALGDQDKEIWCADSFQGLPTPDLEKYPQDEGVRWHEVDVLAVSLEQVKANFQKYDLLDNRVHFLKGWFKDTLATAPIDRIAVLRLDGDMYESTMDALCALYDKVSPGGFIIVDDYGIPEDTCRRATDDFRKSRGIVDEIIDIDGFGAFWQRSS